MPASKSRLMAREALFFRLLLAATALTDVGRSFTSGRHFNRVTLLLHGRRSENGNEVNKKKSRRPGSYMEELKFAESIEQLQSTLSAMREKRVHPETHHYNVAISRATHLSGGSAGLAFFDELLAQSKGSDTKLTELVHPDEFTFSAAIKAAGEHDWRQAVDIFKAASSYGVQPDVYCYTAAISACRRAAVPTMSRNQRSLRKDHTVACDVALGLYREMMRPKPTRSTHGFKSTRVVPNEYTYSALIGACEKAGRWKEAVALIENMLCESQLMEPPPFVWTSAIVACDRGGNPDAALKLLRLMCSSPRVIKILEAWSSSDLGFDAKVTVDSAVGGSVEGRKVSLDRVLEAGMSDKGAVESDTIRGVAMAFNAAITACGRNSRWEAALKLFNGMRDSRAGRRLLGLASTGEESGKHSATALWPAPDVVSFNAILGALATAERIDEATEIFNDMRKIAARDIEKSGGNYRNKKSNHFLVPTEMTFNIFLSILSRAQRWNEAFHLLTDMEASSDGVTAATVLVPKPSQTTYNILFHECENAGRQDLVLDLQARVAQKPAISLSKEETPQKGNVLYSREAFPKFSIPSTKYAGDWVCSSCGWVNRQRNSVCGGVLPTGVPESSRRYGCGALKTALEPNTSASSVHEYSDTQLQMDLLEGPRSADHDDFDISLFEGETEDDGNILAERGMKTWEVQNGQPVEVWFKGRLILGNAIVTSSNHDEEECEDTAGRSCEDKKQPLSKPKQKSKSGVAKLQVLVFDPSIDLVGGSRDDDHDNFDKYIMQSTKVSKAEAARAVINVGIDQLVCAWNTLRVGPPLIGSVFYPRSVAEWSRAARDGDLLRARLPSKRRIEDIWLAYKSMQRRETDKATECFLTSHNVAYFLLYGILSSEENLAESGLDLRVIVAAHMTASTMLSSASSTHFKRSVPTLVQKEEGGKSHENDRDAENRNEDVEEGGLGALESLLQGGANPKDIAAMKSLLGNMPTAQARNSDKAEKIKEGLSLCLMGGGWQALAQSVVLSRKVSSFKAAVEQGRRIDRQNGYKSTAKNSTMPALDVVDNKEDHRYIAEQLELLALGGGASVLGSEGKQALKALQAPATAEAAVEILLAVGFWSRKKASSAVESAKQREARYNTAIVQAPSSRAAPLVSHWPSEVLQCAMEKASLVYARRRRLAAISLPQDSGVTSLRPVDTSCVVAGSSDDPTFAAAADLLARVALEERSQRSTGNPTSESAKTGAEKSAAAVFSTWPSERWAVGSHGKVDLRTRSEPSEIGQYTELLPLCIDKTRTGLKDDAISWDEATHTLLVHSTTHLVQCLHGNAGATSRHSAAKKRKADVDVDLDAVAARRGEACYLPDGALLLLPAPLLNAASLASGFESIADVSEHSDSQRNAGVATANECITLAFRFNPSDGSLLGSWLFESVIGPVTSITFDVADATLRTSACAPDDEHHVTGSSMLDPSTAKTLKALHEIVPWLEKARNRYHGHTGVRTKDATKLLPTSPHVPSCNVPSSLSSERIVDLALSLFSEEAYLMTRQRRVTPPRVGRAVRYATAPLRRYTDLLAQRQLLSLVRPPHLPLSAERVRSAMTIALARRGVISTALEKQESDKDHM